LDINSTAGSVEHERVVCSAVRLCGIQATGLQVNSYPFGAHNISMVAVAAGVVEHVSLTFVEVVECERASIGRKTLCRREFTGVTSFLRNARLVDESPGPMTIEDGENCGD